MAMAMACWETLATWGWGVGGGFRPPAPVPLSAPYSAAVGTSTLKEIADSLSSPLLSPKALARPWIKQPQHSRSASLCLSWSQPVASWLRLQGHWRQGMGPESGLGPGGWPPSLDHPDHLRPRAGCSPAVTLSSRPGRVACALHPVNSGQVTLTLRPPQLLHPGPRLTVPASWADVRALSKASGPSQRSCHHSARGGWTQP